MISADASKVTEAHRLTRANFYEVGELAGATECWGLEAPLPELRWIDARGNITARAHIGDVIVRVP